MLVEKLSLLDRDKKIGFSDFVVEKDMERFRGKYITVDVI